MSKKVLREAEFALVRGDSAEKIAKMLYNRGQQGSGMKRSGSKLGRRLRSPEIQPSFQLLPGDSEAAHARDIQMIELRQHILLEFVAKPSASAVRRRSPFWRACHPRSNAVTIS
jgi:hypothetical protein